MKHRKLKLKLKRIGSTTTTYKRGEAYPVTIVEKYADGLTFYTMRTPNGLRFTSNDCINKLFEWV